MTLGQNIQAARRAKGLSQEALAEQVGVSRQALGKWEKDTTLPGLDNLQALAAVLGTGVADLLGAQTADPAAPAVTLDAMRDLLAARDAEEKRRRRLWGCAAGTAFIVLVGLLAGVAFQYERQIETLRNNILMEQNYYDNQQQELTAKIEELQRNVRMGEATVADWRWTPVDKLHRDADKSWMPVQVQVTPRTVRDGVMARLSVRCGDDTQIYKMTAASDGSYTAQGIVFSVGSTYELSVQWSADGTATNEILDTIDFDRRMTEPSIYFDRVGDTNNHDFGYRVSRVGREKYLTLDCYPVEVEVNAPSWMTIARVEMDLRLEGDAGESTATILLSTEGDSAVENVSRAQSYWAGTFYSAEAAEGWLFTDEYIPKFVARVTDTSGNVWTQEMLLNER